MASMFHTFAFCIGLVHLAFSITLVIHVYTRSGTKRKRVLDPKQLSLWQNKLDWLQSKYIGFDLKIVLLILP